MLCVSNEILNEYEEIIERYSSASVARNVISAIVHSPCLLYTSPASASIFFAFRAPFPAGSPLRESSGGIILLILYNTLLFLSLIHI